MLKKILEKLKQNSFWGNLVKNSFWAFFGDTFASLVTLIVTIVLIRLIGNENYGVLILGQSYMLIMDVLLNVQSWKGVIQFGQKALVEERKEDLYGYVKLGSLVDIITAILGGLVSLFLVDIVGNFLGWSSDLMFCAKIFSFTIFSHFSGTPTAVLRISNKFNLVAIQKFVASIIKLLSLLIIVIIYNKIDLKVAVIVYCVTDIIGNLLLIIFAVYVFSKKYGLRKIVTASLPNDKNDFIRFTLWGTLSEVVDVPVNYFDMFIISTLGTNLVAVFKVFKQVVAILSKLTTPIYQAIMPQFSELAAKGLKEEGFKVVIKIRNVILKVMLPISILIGISSVVWLDIIYGNIYSQNWYILLVFLIVQTFALSYTTIHPYFISLGYAKQSALYVLISNIIYIILALFITSKLGMFGLVLCYFVQSLIVIFLKIYYVKKKR